MGAGASAGNGILKVSSQASGLRASTSSAASWRARPLEAQLCGVLRHTERGDEIGQLVNGQCWARTSEFPRWILDPPLSDEGQDSAKVLGEGARQFCNTAGAPFHVVVTSPFRRCIQTAVAVCQQLGPDVRLLIDYSLGEIYGPSIMGTERPEDHLRPLSEARALCKAHGVTCLRKVLGKQPIWPEDVRSARRRFASRFLTYLNRGRKTRRNFLLVTHGDGVAASFSTMPSQVGHSVKKVEFGGMFLCHRKCKDATQQPQRASIHGSAVSFMSMPSIEDDEADEVSEALTSDVVASPRHPCAILELPFRRQSVHREAWADPLTLPHDSDGWVVESHGIALQEKEQEEENSANIEKKVKLLAKHSLFSKDQVERLLGVLPDTPIEGACLASPLIPQRNTEQSWTHCSASTFLFGSSDVAEDDIGSLAGDEPTDFGRISNRLLSRNSSQSQRPSLAQLPEDYQLSPRGEFSDGSGVISPSKSACCDTELRLDDSLPNRPSGFSVPKQFHRAKFGTIEKHFSSLTDGVSKVEDAPTLLSIKGRMPGHRKKKQPPSNNPCSISEQAICAPPEVFAELRQPWTSSRSDEGHSYFTQVLPTPSRITTPDKPSAQYSVFGRRRCSEPAVESTPGSAPERSPSPPSSRSSARRPSVSSMLSRNLPRRMFVKPIAVAAEPDTGRSVASDVGPASDVGHLCAWRRKLVSRNVVTPLVDAVSDPDTSDGTPKDPKPPSRSSWKRPSFSSYTRSSKPHPTHVSDISASCFDGVLERVSDNSIISAGVSGAGTSVSPPLSPPVAALTSLLNRRRPGSHLAPLSTRQADFATNAESGVDRQAVVELVSSVGGKSPAKAALSSLLGRRQPDSQLNLPLTAQTRAASESVEKQAVVTEQNDVSAVDKSRSSLLNRRKAMGLAISVSTPSSKAA